MVETRAQHRKVFQQSKGEDEKTNKKKEENREPKFEEAEETEETNQMAFDAVKTGNLPLLKALVFDRRLAEQSLDRLREYCCAQYQNNTQKIRALELWLAQLSQLEQFSDRKRVQDLYKVLFDSAYREARERCVLASQNYLQGLGLKLEKKALYEISGDDGCWKEVLVENQEQ